MRGQTGWPRSQVSAPWSLSSCRAHQGRVKPIHGHEKSPGSWNSCYLAKPHPCLTSLAASVYHPPAVVSVRVTPASTGWHRLQHETRLSANACKGGDTLEDGPQQPGTLSLLLPTQSRSAEAPSPKCLGSRPPLRVINPSHNSCPTFTSVSCVQSLSRAHLSCDRPRNCEKRCVSSLSLGPLLLPW